MQDFGLSSYPFLPLKVSHQASHVFTLHIWHFAAATQAHPIVVMKLEVKESSENLNSKQLFPTPATMQ